MKERIKQLEKLSTVLEPDEASRAILLEKIVQYTNVFLKNVNKAPAYVTSDEGIGLYDSPICENPVDMDSILTLIKKNID